MSILRRLDPRHWTLGGTFVMNFGNSKLGLYREAAKRYGDPGIVVLSEAEAPVLRGHGGCLHNVTGHDHIYGFWRVFDEVVAERKGGEFI